MNYARLALKYICIVISVSVVLMGLQRCNASFLGRCLYLRCCCLYIILVLRAFEISFQVLGNQKFQETSIIVIKCVLELRASQFFASALVLWTADALTNVKRYSSFEN